MHTDPTVLIIGAGPAGLGCAVALKSCGVEDLRTMDKSNVGASFEAWPSHLRLLTPSFQSHASGIVDLNAVTPCFSPAEHLQEQHPTGAQYSMYLKALAFRHGLRFMHGTAQGIQHSGDVLRVESSRGVLHPRFVIWAAGEIGHPAMGGIEGAALCVHSSTVRDWSSLPEETFTIVGGSESGVDAAIELVWLGKEVHLLSRGEPWGKASAEAERGLSGFTRERLQDCICDAPGSLRFHKHTHVVKVAQVPDGYELTDVNGTLFHSPTQPILATGFRSSLDIVRQNFAWSGEDLVLDDSTDESTLTPGLFYAGPALVRGVERARFIHQFRSRFGIVARSIAQRMGLEWEQPLKLWRERGFMVEEPGFGPDISRAANSEEMQKIELALHAAV